jgi:hypothetical protein
VWDKRKGPEQGQSGKQTLMTMQNQRVPEEWSLPSMRNLGCTDEKMVEARYKTVEILQTNQRSWLD